jgi:SAM-dependent methyltransferase
MKTAVNTNNQVYYTGQYWNDFPQVLEYMCKNFTGDKSRWWVTDFKDRYATQAFRNGLFLNCGNGWVEREFVDKNIVEQAVAFDYSPDLIKTADKEKGTRAIHYFRTDANKIAFPENTFDLVVNVAALHHVQYINRLCQTLCESLNENGILVNFDYIGPARNQYSARHWGYIRQVNKLLPDHIQKSPLIRPHLPSMLHTDPTEAIHSDLIIPTVSNFFEILERHDTGGGIAYEILTNNSNLNSVSKAALTPYLHKVLELDEEYTQTKKVPPLFSYFIAKPNKTILRDKEKLRSFQLEEDRREIHASKTGGTYTLSEQMKVLTHRVQNRVRTNRLVRSLKPALEWFRGGGA